MPFTPCHAVAVIPLARWKLVPSALVIGSMAPDIPYFLLLSLQPRFGHTLPGMLLVALPAGLGALWVYHRILKRPLLSLLPDDLQVRLAPLVGTFSFGPLRQFLRILASLLLGILSHTTWDAFTHLNGWGVRLVPFLAIPTARLGRMTFAACDVLQHLSTVVGGGLLALWCLGWYRRTEPGPVSDLCRLSPATKFGFLAVVSGWACLTALLYGFRCVPVICDFSSLRVFGGRVVVSGISALCVGFAAFSLSQPGAPEPPPPSLGSGTPPGRGPGDRSHPDTSSPPFVEYASSTALVEASPGATKQFD